MIRDVKAEGFKSIRAMERSKDKVIIGKDKLKQLNKKVGERVKVTSMNYKEIDLEFEIVGTFPPEISSYARSSSLTRIV